jgi:hypothetical protein
MMLRQWSRVFLSNMNFSPRLQAFAPTLVAAERNGEPFDSQLLVEFHESNGTHLYLFYIYSFLTITYTPPRL